MAGEESAHGPAALQAIEFRRLLFFDAVNGWPAECDDRAAAAVSAGAAWIHGYPGWSFALRRRTGADLPDAARRAGGGTSPGPQRHCVRIHRLRDRVLHERDI